MTGRSCYLILIILFSGSIFSINGCAPIRRADRDIEERYFHYRISNPGENLRIISEWYCGNSTDWKHFYIPAEREQRTLRKNDAVLIPVELVRQKGPIPAEFVESRRPKERSSLAANAPPEGNLITDEFLDKFSEPVKNENAERNLE